MSFVAFPIYDSFRSAWVTGPFPVEKPYGIISLGYQGIEDNSVASVRFGRRKSSKKSVKKTKKTQKKQKVLGKKKA